MRKYILPIIVLLLLTSTVLGHDWYPMYCCGTIDCKQVPCSEIVPQADGTFKWLDTYIFDTDTPSKDNFCHVCISSAHKPLCLFTPQGNS